MRRRMGHLQPGTTLCCRNSAQRQAAVRGLLPHNSLQQLPPTTPSNNSRLSPAAHPPSAPAVAGHDTSSSALTCMLAALAADPAALSRLSAERAAVSAAHGRALTPAAAAAAPYAAACIRETLRLRPIVSGAMRVAERDITLAGGAGVVPKGCPILMAFSSMAEREPAWQDSWGQFRPERFLVEPGAAGGAAALAPQPSSFNPFGIGQRSAGRRGGLGA
jgi:cytochrome P450